MVAQVFVVAAVDVVVAVAVAVVGVGVVRCTQQLRAISLWISFCLSKLKDFPLYVLLQPMFGLRPLQTTIKHSCASAPRTPQYDHRARKRVEKGGDCSPGSLCFHGLPTCLQICVLNSIKQLNC